ncbi:MAG: zinc ribbon domain-containing protein [Anaerolineae bacterium]
MSNTIEDASHKTCTHCGKQFEGDIFNGPHLMSTLKTQFKSEEPFKKLALGIECPHCGAVFCADCATSTENLCPKCGQRGLEKLVVWDNHSAMSAHAAKAHIAQHWLSIDDSGHAHTIDAEQELTTCPGCQTSVAVGVEFCPACGYEFATKESAKGPVYFTYPQPAEAYVPSGKTTLPALAAMVLGSAIIGPAIGLLLYPVHQVGATLLAGLLSWGQGKAIIGAAVFMEHTLSST